MSAGASFAIVLAVGVFGLGSFYGYVWFAFAGALRASVVVYVLGGLGRSGLTPVKLALAGISVTSLLSSLTSAVALTDPDALDRYRFWSAVRWRTRTPPPSCGCRPSWPPAPCWP